MKELDDTVKTASLKMFKSFKKEMENCFFLKNQINSCSLNKKSKTQLLGIHMKHF